MTTTLGWTDALLRILLTVLTVLTVLAVLAVLADAAIGYERSERGRTAGLRTTLLVALAACLAMLQANWLIDTAGKAPDFFVELDLMRLPLGILSGVGFIGAGAILQRGNLVLGITTASTLWFVTVMGLCFGGGQPGFGITGSILAVLIVSVLKVVEERMREDRPATLTVKWHEGSVSESDLLAAIRGCGPARLAPVGKVSRRGRYERARAEPGLPGAAQRASNAAGPAPVRAQARHRGTRLDDVAALLRSETRCAGSLQTHGIWCAAQVAKARRPSTTAGSRVGPGGSDGRLKSSRSNEGPAQRSPALFLCVATASHRPAS